MNGTERLLPETPEVAINPSERNEPSRRRLIGRAMLKASGMLLASATVLGMYEYQSDVYEVQRELADTHPYIIENSPVPVTEPALSTIPRGAFEGMTSEERAYIRQTLQPERIAVVNMPGFGLVDTYQADKVLSSFNSMAANWSVHYDNTGIDTRVIAREIVKKAHEENIDQVGLYADSMGTIIESKVAVEIEHLDPDLRIPFIVMDSPAVGLQVLRPKSRNDGYALLDGIKLPGAEYSRYARMAAEIYLRKDSVHGIGEFFSTFNEVHDQVFNDDDMPANNLLAEQFQMIISSNVEGNLRELGKLAPEKRPLIVFMGAADAAADDVVNTPQSLKLLRKWTDEANLTLLGPYGIQDFYHGAQWRSAKEYQEVIGEQIVPQILSAAANVNATMALNLRTGSSEN